MSLRFFRHMSSYVIANSRPSGFTTGIIQISLLSTSQLILASEPYESVRFSIS